MTARYLSMDQVVRIHRELMQSEGQAPVLVSEEKLEAAVARPRASVFGHDAYPTLAEKAAALLESLAIAHPFLDGNKRVAFAAMDTFFRLNGVLCVPDEDAAYELVIGVASGVVKGVDEIAERLRGLFGIDVE